MATKKAARKPKAKKLVKAKNMNVVKTLSISSGGDRPSEG